DETWGTTDTDRTRYAAWFLPDVFRIDGDRDALRIEDENGAIMADVTMDNDTQYGSYSGDNDRGARAHWISDRRFEVERVGRYGRRVTQTFTLENRGRDLVVATQVERDGSTRMFTRYYERA